MPKPLRKPFQKILDTILGLLDKGVIPWRKPWNTVFPGNFVTKRPYSGINQIMLWSAGFGSPWWLTRRQLDKLGGRLKPGADPHLIVGTFWGKPRVRLPGTPETRPFMRAWQVFNVEQCEGLPVPPVEPKAPLPGAVGILRAYRHHPRYRRADNAWYMPASDTIGMPVMTSFVTTAEYYVTLFHELAHSTAHPSRLGREWKGRTHAYDREELTAELTAAFLMAAAGLEFPAATTNQAAYIQHWRQNLLDDPLALFDAARAAQKATDYLLMKPAKPPRKPSRAKGGSSPDAEPAGGSPPVPAAEPEKRSA